ncbi:MAG TPA: radical SAM protein [Chitinophagales bacterium]|nr:radical SAM protein [Chitinophagales bacterium]
MRILLTHGYFLALDEREQQIMRPYVPLGLLYISAWLNKHDVAHDVLDTTFMQPDAQWDYINTIKPDVIALYVNLMTRKHIVSIMQRIRSDANLSETRIILGGPEVRNHAEQFLQFGADYLVLGEGEESFLELIQCLQNNLPTYQIKGIAQLDVSGKVCISAEREKMRNLDDLPMPNREAVDLQHYLDVWKKHHGKNAISVSTMRGCPYTCTWCSRAVYGQSYRRRSPEKVVEELVHIQNTYAPDTIWFVDDVFTISHKWLSSFADAIEKQSINMPFECITRADRMSEEVIHLLKRAGCFRVWIGAESGSQRIIDAMDRRVDVTQVQEMIRLTRAQGIEAGTFIMLGYPGEAESDIHATVQHLIAAQPDYFTITTAYPIKGTALYTTVQPSITQSPDWATGSDREIQFARTYPETYYPHAVRYVVHAVAYTKTHKWMHLLKAKVALLGMQWVRLVHAR